MVGSSQRQCQFSRNPQLQNPTCPRTLTSFRRKLYVVMFNVLDNCYCQNLGFEHPLTTANGVPQILEGERQLEDWRISIVPSLGIRLWHEPLLPENLAQLDSESTIRHRFGIVLSVRYHNLRILLYRRFLECYLDSYSSEDPLSLDNKLFQRMGFTGVQNCVDSAMSMISTVHTITSSGGWHRGLLGAWYYSLYYSKSSYAPYCAHQVLLVLLTGYPFQLSMRVL